ncbi:MULTISPECIES: protein-glutamate O-methyltransferase CheR [unclassified Rhizobacter]|uniref:CheR family methyltransferase n=1 Tax=unclassified Rhizobacter TaxID=2640088 RepID=UPI0006FC35B8|nr:MULTISPECIES: protein-glutamate O-methyltransferase CheR [unclassified Rhizobacter]KQU81235.1 SAM-dependent methyltransferase [Rhizobacter sp. Root29]KQW15388.1 SAM-dependent methyltransferase [Rhizobacter sp. Root1238]KRB12420.1 SAM-dependent methyltransferase [Rhizobacter sp. Root16D2]
MHTISDNEFGLFQRFIYDAAGITLSSAKKALVCGRLAKRLQACNLGSYAEYFKLLSSGQNGAEVQTAVDLLTTNETYFFREPRHFELLREAALPASKKAQPFRVWSAASSTGEEAYSIAMVLADTLGDAAWEVMGSDISTRVLQRARQAHYPMERCRQIPQAYLKRFCLKGIDEQQGTLLVDRSLRGRVQFMQVNLNTALPRLAAFDVIFLRNVMIYFNGDTKRQVVARIIEQLKPGGFFCIGHSESLNDISTALHQVAPSIYRKP